jgi:hypothetical protein
VFPNAHSNQLLTLIWKFGPQLHETGSGAGEDDDDDEDEGHGAAHSGGGGGGGSASSAADAEPSNYIVVANSEFKFKLWQYDASQIQVYLFGIFTLDSLSAFSPFDTSLVFYCLLRLICLAMHFFLASIS